MYSIINHKTQKSIAQGKSCNNAIINYINSGNRNFMFAIFDLQKFENITFRHFTFNDCKFRITKIDDSNLFERCKFINCDFSGSNISNSIFRECIFEDCILNSIEAIKTSFQKCKISNTQMNRIYAKGALFNDVITINVPCYSSDLSYTSWNNADMTGLQCAYTSMRGIYYNKNTIKSWRNHIFVSEYLQKRSNKNPLYLSYSNFIFNNPQLCDEFYCNKDEYEKEILEWMIRSFSEEYKDGEPIPEFLKNQIELYRSNNQIEE